LNASTKDIQYYIRTTDKWYDEYKITHKDMISGSFLTTLKDAAKQYKVELKYSS
jgi:hypothetical protein